MLFIIYLNMIWMNVGYQLLLACEIQVNELHGFQQKRKYTPICDGLLDTSHVGH